jgi:hypothetical protein
MCWISVGRWHSSPGPQQAWDWRLLRLSPTQARLSFWQTTNRNGQVAYASQFADPDGRAHRGKERIKSRLIADLNPDEWDCPLSQNGCAGGPITDTSRSLIVTKSCSILDS